MEIVIILFVLIAGSLAFSAWRKSRSSHDSPSVEETGNLDNGLSVRKCRACGYEGEMKTWLSHYNAPKIIVVAGFLLGYLPGLIFLAIYWGKYKCPSCGSVGKSQQVSDMP